MTTRKSFTKEFKLEAIRLLEKSDKTGTEIARELGIRRNMLYKWLDEVKEKGDNAFKGSGRPLTSDNNKCMGSNLTFYIDVVCKI